MYRVVINNGGNILDEDNCVYTMIIDFDMSFEKPETIVSETINFLVGLWQGLNRTIHDLKIENNTDNKMFVLFESVYRNILDISVNKLTQKTYKSNDKLRNTCHNIGIICNTLTNGYSFRWGYIMEVLQLCDSETMYTCIDNIHYLAKGYSSYALDFIEDYAGSQRFMTSGKRILEVIDTLLAEKKYKIGFYVYNNTMDGQFSEFNIHPKKVNDTIMQLFDHKKLFSRNKIIVDLMWLRYMHNSNKNKTIVAFPIGLFYRAENNFTNKPRFSQYFFKIEYSDMKNPAGSPGEIKKFVDLLKTNTNTTHIEIR